MNSESVAGSKEPNSGPLRRGGTYGQQNNASFCQFAEPSAQAPLLSSGYQQYTVLGTYEAIGSKRPPRSFKTSLSSSE